MAKNNKKKGKNGQTWLKIFKFGFKWSTMVKNGQKLSKIV